MVIFANLLATGVHAGEHPASEPAPSGRVLVLCSYGYGLHGYDNAVPAIRAELESAGFNGSHFFVEYMDLLRSRDKETRVHLADLYRQKYAGTQIDVIITINLPALNFFSFEGRDLFPDTPIISICVPDTSVPQKPGRRIVIQDLSPDTEGTLKLASKLFPGTKRVVCVSGVTEEERRAGKAAESVFAGWRDRFEFQSTDTLTVEETIQVLQNLQSDAIVLFIALHADKTGRTMMPKDIAALLSSASKVPVFASYDSVLGAGVVGGSLVSARSEGGYAGRLAVDYLSGDLKITDKPIVVSNNRVPCFDWQQLNQWGVDESEIPAGSVVINRPEAIWKRYKGYLISALTIFVVQFIMIMGLLINRRRRMSAEESLRKAEDKYRNIFEGALEGIYETSPSGKTLTANPALAKMFGYESLEEMTASLAGLGFQVWSDPEDRDSFIRLLEDRGVVLDYESRFFRKDKTPVWVSLSSRCIYGQDGKILCYSGFMLDISERKRIENELAESQVRIGAVFNSTEDFIWSVDPVEFGLVTWNKAFENYFRKSRGIELRVGMTPEQLVPPDFVPVWNDLFTRAVRDGSLVTEYTVVEGTIILLLSLNTLRRNGEVFGISVFGKDITERKRVEEELRRSEERYRALVETSSDWVWEVDSDGRYTYADPKVYKILGYRPEEVLGRTPFELMPEDEARRMRAIFAEIVADRREFSGLINANVHRDGRLVRLETGGVPIISPDGRFVGYRGMDRDVTERAIAEEALRASEEKFRQLAENIREVFWIREQNKLTYISPSCEEIFGIDKERLCEKPDSLLEIVHEEDKKRALKMYSGNQEMKAISQEFRIVRSDGDMRWISARSFPVLNSGGPVRTVGVAEDVTNWKRMEEQLQSRLRVIEKLRRQLEQENISLREEVTLLSPHPEVVAQSQAMQRIMVRVEQVGPTDASVLITGETGTGKEVIARAIHRSSLRKGLPLVVVNCASLPSTLIESELFGREKGAFTGAMSRMVGRFEVADESTLFLDEIGDLPLEVQAKLLRVLEEGHFERLGSSKPIKVNVRIIAATNRDLEKMVQSGNFRKDLYYRLNVFPIVIPPLRDRPEDIPQLIWAFVRQFETRMGKHIQSIPKRSMEALLHYSWPGNARELRNVVEHAMIVSRSMSLDICPPALPSPEETLDESGTSLREIEQNHILRVLEEVGWRVSGRGGAAEVLGLKPTTLEARMKKLGIRRPVT